MPPMREHRSNCLGIVCIGHFFSEPIGSLLCDLPLFDGLMVFSHEIGGICIMHEKGFFISPSYTIFYLWITHIMHITIGTIDFVLKMGHHRPKKLTFRPQISKIFQGRPPEPPLREGKPLPHNFVLNVSQGWQNSQCKVDNRIKEDIWYIYLDRLLDTILIWVTE